MLFITVRYKNKITNLEGHFHTKSSPFLSLLFYVFYLLCQLAPQREHQNPDIYLIIIINSLMLDDGQIMFLIIFKP